MQEIVNMDLVFITIGCGGLRKKSISDSKWKDLVQVKAA